MNFLILGVLVLTASAGLFFTADSKESIGQTQSGQTAESQVLIGSGKTADRQSADRQSQVSSHIRQETDLNSRTSSDTHAAGYVKAKISF